LTLPAFINNTNKLLGDGMPSAPVMVKPLGGPHIAITHTPNLEGRGWLPDYWNPTVPTLLSAPQAPIHAPK